MAIEKVNEEINLEIAPDSAQENYNTNDGR
jgi:hypothetical protein